MRRIATDHLDSLSTNLDLEIESASRLDHEPRPLAMALNQRHRPLRLEDRDGQTRQPGAASDIGQRTQRAELPESGPDTPAPDPT